MVGSVVRGKPVETYRNSDLAFWGRLAYAGHYEGFQVIDTANPRKPEVVSDFSCPGSQHDVSVWQGLLFVSVETPRSSPACDSVPQTPGFEGIRIFDVSNPRSPVAGQRRPDRLRVAHAHAGARPAQRSGAALHRLVHGERHRAVPVRQRVRALRRERPDRPQQDLGRRGAAAQPGGGERGQRAALPAERLSRHAGLPRLPRHHRVHGDREGRRRVHGRGPDLGHLRSREPAHDRARPQPERRVLPLGDVLLRRASAWCSATRPAAGRGRAAGRPTRRRSARCGSTT